MISFFNRANPFDRFCPFQFYGICNEQELASGCANGKMCTSKPDFTKSKKHNSFDGLKLRIDRGLSLRFANIYLISSPSIKGSIISLLSAQTKVELSASRS